MSRLLTLSQVADQLQISERRARQIVAAQSLAVVRIGRLIRVREKALGEYIARNEISASLDSSPIPLSIVRPASAHPDAEALEEVALRHRLG